MWRFGAFSVSVNAPRARPSSSSESVHVYLLCQRCPRSTYLLSRQTLDFCLWEAFILSYQLFFFSLSSCLVNLELWAHLVHSSTSERGKMTLKSNKNEPALILESVNSVRTALSDLYLEQLLQNKPKSDKVTFSCCGRLSLLYFAKADFRAHVFFPGSRGGPHDHCSFLLLQK